MPLAESRGGASGGVWGNAPTVPRATNSKDEVNKGADSEASLPVTLRFLRSAPQAALPTTCILSRRWARPTSIERSFFLLLVFFVAGGRACGCDKGAMETDEVCGRPLDPFAVRSHVYCFFSLQGGTKGTLNYSNDKSQLWGRAAEGVQRAIGKPSGTMPMTRLEKKSTLLT